MFWCGRGVLDHGLCRAKGPMGRHHRFRAIHLSSLFGRTSSRCSDPVTEDHGLHQSLKRNKLANHTGLVSITVLGGAFYPSFTCGLRSPELEAVIS